MLPQVVLEELPRSPLQDFAGCAEKITEFNSCVGEAKRSTSLHELAKKEDKGRIENQHNAVASSTPVTHGSIYNSRLRNTEKNVCCVRGAQGLNNKKRLASAPGERTRLGTGGHSLHERTLFPVTEMNPTRLFIASLGNPPPYSSTRHSAGHIMVKALQSYLQLPPFQKSKTYANGLTSFGADAGRPDFTLWQSPSLMNVSGVGLLKAYKAFAATTQLSPTDPLPGMIILYDEMETAPSQLRLRRGATSAKGHNGLKSVQQSLQSAGLLSKLGDRYVKIGIGIGRPAGGSRTSDDVSRYVLGQLTVSEKDAIDNKASELVSLLETELSRMSR